jgi:hypothetical protein
MRLGTRVSFGIFAILLTTPLWARPNSSHIDKAQWTPAQQSKIGDKDFTPGSYQLTAAEAGTEMDVLKAGKMVAQIPCHWIQLPQKAHDNAIFMDTNNNVTQVQFEGRTEAVQIP